MVSATFHVKMEVLVVPGNDEEIFYQEIIFNNRSQEEGQEEIIQEQ